MQAEIKTRAATLVAINAFAGLGIQFAATYAQCHSVSLTLWIILGYFTILTNLLVALVFSAIAFDRTVLRAPSIVAGTTLSILLVGIVYGLLLHGTLELSGSSAVANVLLHMVTPLLVFLYWLFLTRKGALTWKHPLLWAIYPLAYLAYALARGSATGKYAYPFLDTAAIGILRTLLNAFIIAIAFMLAAYVMVFVDRRFAVRKNSP